MRPLSAGPFMRLGGISAWRRCAVTLCCCCWSATTCGPRERFMAPRSGPACSWSCCSRCEFQSGEPSPGKVSPRGCRISPVLST